MADYCITGGDDLVEYYVFDATSPDAALDRWARDSGYESFEAMCDDGVVDPDAVVVEPLSDMDDDSIPDDVRERRNALDRLWPGDADVEEVPATQQKAEAELQDQGYTLERAEPLDEAPHRRVTYWTRDDTDEVVVKQVHPNGDVRTYDEDEWGRVQEYLDA